MLRCLKAANPTLANARFARVRDPEVDRAISKMDRDIVISHYKFGILYAARDQIDENDMYCNGTERILARSRVLLLIGDTFMGAEHGSPDFDEFCEFLGTRITLKDWNKYRGGLDVKSNDRPHTRTQIASSSMHARTYL